MLKNNTFLKKLNVQNIFQFEKIVRKFKKKFLFIKGSGFRNSLFRISKNLPVSNFCSFFAKIKENIKKCSIFFKKNRISKFAHVSKNIRQFIIITLFLKVQKDQKIKTCFECDVVVCS